MTSPQEEAAIREMTVDQYLAECEEVRQATARMATIDARIAKMSPQEQAARRGQIQKGRTPFDVGSRNWLTAMLEADAYEVLEVQATRKTALFQKMASTIECIRTQMQEHAELMRIRKHMGRPRKA